MEEENKIEKNKTIVDEETRKKLSFFKAETRKFQMRWNEALTAGDPYYNPNLNRMKEDFSPRV